MIAAGRPLLPHAIPEVYVDATDVVFEPSVDGVDELEGISGPVAACLVALPKVASDCEEGRVGLLVLLRHGAAVLLHAGHIWIADLYNHRILVAQWQL